MASSEQIELSNFIKTVHHELRNLALEEGFDGAWEKHCKDENTLKRYAEAMHILAVNHWGGKNKDDPSRSRIIWVHEQSSSYFRNGLLLKSRDKELRLRSSFNLSDNEHSIEFIKFHPPFRLLDVGSCYNPFSAFQEFQTIAIDLMPATKDVLQCDFLKVPIVEKTVSFEQCHECTVLPALYFDIVVFSLFLEYIPAPTKRYECCVKAHQLLRPEGILMILTPDSRHESANSKLLRAWRLSLAKIGFFRVGYTKLQHLHGLVFRKCIDSRVSQFWSQRQPDSIYSSESLSIPQDVSDFMSNNQILSSDSVFVKSSQDEEIIASDFTFLPNIDAEN
nr:PREDICTED: probable methyltransferase BTM2 homolog isoform X2 [Bemisia tabaci]XP_018897948.1 PREDICTED: probable methyltransferase BTM2 homolog isoform X2 [Bemisia tabaci]